MSAAAAIKAPEIEGVVGARHGKGELVFVIGPHQVGRSRAINKLLKKLPAGATFSQHMWPWSGIKIIKRELREGLFVFVESAEGVVDLPVKPYRLVKVGAKASA